ncbi:MAG: hypothetical protein DDT34_00925 [Firmicutes bacterium]|nr:hypothetical protein [Bacillota bacterium]
MTLLIRNAGGSALFVAGYEELRLPAAIRQDAAGGPTRGTLLLLIVGAYSYPCQPPHLSGMAP